MVAAYSSIYGAPPTHIHLMRIFVMMISTTLFNCQRCIHHFPRAPFSLLQFQSSFTYATLTFCIKFYFSLFTCFAQTKTQKQPSHNNPFSCILEHLSSTSFSFQFKSNLVFHLLLPVGSILLFRNQLQTICALAVIKLFSGAVAGELSAISHFTFSYLFSLC